MGDTLVEFNYKNLSLIQSFFIFITAISIFDMGYSGDVNKGIWFNHVLFHVDSMPSFLKDTPFWGEFQFWGYNFIIVTACQVLKAVPPHTINFHKLSHSSGSWAGITLIAAPTIAIITNIPDYDFNINTLSSLVEFGWFSTILVSWGFMWGALLYVPFFIYSGKNFGTSPFSYTAIAAAGFGIFSSIMLFFIGITLPTDQPYDHGMFVNPYWFCISISIIFLSYQLEEDAKDLRWRNLPLKGSGLFIGLFVIVLLLMRNIIDIPTFMQLIIGLAVQVWLLAYIQSLYKD
jgi:hypothetical protein